jgi:hypothetical protein
MRYFIRRLLLFLIPLYLIIISYFLIDPFRVLYNYDDYYLDAFCQLNRENVSLNSYIKGKKQVPYNSFVFGSSRTLAYKTTDWRQVVNSDNFYPFVFDASNESIEGIASKLEYLDQTNTTINNALIIVCTDVTFNKDFTNKKEHLYIKHPELSNNSRVRYCFAFFKAYFTNGFFIKYLDYKIFSVERKYMSNAIDLRYTRTNSVTNDLYLDDQESAIVNDSLSFYEKYKYSFYVRPGNELICKEQIGQEDILQLTRIADILKKHKTNFKIIIGPLYDQKKFNSVDLRKLTSIFGNENVFDYSGINAITANKFNYLENSHYRYSAGRRIMQEIYHNTN